jgi:glycosyltransferase involved in cell wall biosynthesis
MTDPDQNDKGDPVDVSVVIPSRDRRGPLERCLNALVEQTHPHFEVVVVDDASSDGTTAFLQEFSADHPTLPLRWIVNDVNIGANRSRNRGIREARGELVAFTDSDCVPAPDWLERLTAPFADANLGAVTGAIELPSPTNIFEVTYRGTNRVVGKSYVNRLVGGNMCVRRTCLLEYPLDEDLKYGCDEEGLYLKLKAAGFDQRFVPAAHVVHEHHFTGRSLFRQARIGGAGAAWLVYKYHLPPRLDLLPFMLTYLTLPLILVRAWLVVVPAFFFAGALAAITYNDLFRKRKTIGETVLSFPVLLAYYHVRLYGYVMQAIRLRFTKHGVARVHISRIRGRS